MAKTFKLKANIMDKRAMERALMRVAHEIIENNRGVEGLKLVGIQRRGVMLAKILREMIKEVEGVELPKISTAPCRRDNDSATVRA